MNDLPGVLMIAYHFPPMGGPGVQRTLKFARYLPEFGWQPHVLTARDGVNLQDASLEKELPTDLSVTRTPILHLPRQLPWRLRNFIGRWLLLVDEQIGWLPYAKSAGRRLIAAGGIKVIYSTSAPYTAHLIGRALHHQTHLPWVADFRDPWMGNPNLKFPTATHRKLNERLEQSVFNQADRVILNTERSRRYYTQKYSTLPGDKFTTITNGYDPSDLPEADQHAPVNSAFTIIHLGSLYPKTRSSVYFLAAVHEAVNGGKLPPGEFKVRFIGNADKETQAMVRQFELNATVELLGYLPHQQALHQLYTADLLLLIPSYGVASELFIPAKLFEYLATQKPILCLADPGESADLVIKARTGIVVPPTDRARIIEQLLNLFQQWKHGGIKIEPDLGFISAFERRKLTGKLAGLLTEVCA